MYTAKQNIVLWEGEPEPGAPAEKGKGEPEGKAAKSRGAEGAEGKALAAMRKELRDGVREVREMVRALDFDSEVLLYQLPLQRCQGGSVVCRLGPVFCCL